MYECHSMQMTRQGTQKAPHSINRGLQFGISVPFPCSSQESLSHLFKARKNSHSASLCYLNVEIVPLLIFTTQVDS